MRLGDDAQARAVGTALGTWPINNWSNNWQAGWPLCWCKKGLLVSAKAAVACVTNALEPKADDWCTTACVKPSHCASSSDSARAHADASRPAVRRL
jgi:hypothetical protein